MFQDKEQASAQLFSDCQLHVILLQWPFQAGWWVSDLLFIGYLYLWAAHRPHTPQAWLPKARHHLPEHTATPAEASLLPSTVLTKTTSPHSSSSSICAAHSPTSARLRNSPLIHFTHVAYYLYFAQKFLEPPDPGDWEGSDQFGLPSCSRWNPSSAPSRLAAERCGTPSEASQDACCEY